jgi:hypothetical protein
MHPNIFLGLESLNLGGIDEYAAHMLPFSVRQARNGCSKRAWQQGFLNPKLRQFAQGWKPPHATGSKISKPKLVVLALVRFDFFSAQVHHQR